MEEKIMCINVAFNIRQYCLLHLIPEISVYFFKSKIVWMGAMSVHEDIHVTPP